MVRRILLPNSYRKDLLPNSLRKAQEEKPEMLKPWDPMGALA